MRKTPSAICKICGKQVRVRPCGGDWLNAIYPIVHKQSGVVCDGSFREVETGNVILPPRAGKESA